MQRKFVTFQDVFVSIRNFKFVVTTLDAIQLFKSSVQMEQKDLFNIIIFYQTTLKYLK